MDDLISRRNAVYALFDAVNSFYGQEADRTMILDKCVKSIKGLPSAQPERKNGKWLPDNNCYHTPHFVCSACGVSQEVDTVMYKPSWAFCPRCGADMRGEQDG